MIHTIAIFRIKPELRASALQAFQALAVEVLNEPGCLEYAVTVDAEGMRPSKGTLGDDAIAIVEKWASMDAFQAHMQAPHMAAFSAQAKEFVLSRVVHVLQAQGAR